MHEIPAITDMYIPACDVRDVAKAHIAAMLLPEAAGHRHIVTSVTESQAFKEWALLLDKEYRSKGYNVPTTVLPNLFVKIFSIFDPTLKLVTKNQKQSFNIYCNILLGFFR